MARDLTAKQNSQRITDTVGGGIVELFYRLPTTEERVAFRKACMVQDGDEVKFDPFEARVEYGLKVLTGFTPGYFTDGDAPISGDQQSEHYREDWKDLVKDAAPDLLEALGMAVFEGARLLGPAVKEPAKPAKEKQPDAEEVGEAPLPNNSGA